jgi:hypothetical protein
MHISTFNSFAIVVKQIQKKFIRDGFLKLISLRNDRRMKANAANHLASIVKYKITLHKTMAFSKIKITIIEKNHHKNFLNVLAIIYKRKYR